MFNINFGLFKFGVRKMSTSISSMSGVKTMFLKTLKKSFFSYPCPRKLSEIVKISLFEKEQPSTIKEIWQKHYDEKHHAVGFDIEADEMKLLIEKAQQNPFIIFPVRKSSGYYVLLCQNQDKSFIYTFLEDYKRNPQNATPYLVVTMFDELVPKNGVGLVRGDIIGDLTKNESEIIFNLTKKFYTNELDYNNVVIFNKESDKFNFQEHMDNCLKFYN